MKLYGPLTWIKKNCWGSSSKCRVHWMMKTQWFLGSWFNWGVAGGCSGDTQMAGTGWIVTTSISWKMNAVDVTGGVGCKVSKQADITWSAWTISCCQFPYWVTWSAGLYMSGRNVDMAVLLESMSLRSGSFKQQFIWCWLDWERSIRKLHLVPQKSYRLL